MKTIKEPLSNLISKITNNEVLLPDFQRNFVWKESEKQAKLVASVLAKMPVGSILLLNSKASDYAYRMVGCNERKTCTELGIDGEILALLDGQQRVTVLTTAFSDVVFNTAGSAKKLINGALKRRFFLRIPKYNSGEDSVEDFFNAHGLVLPMQHPDKDEPEFLASYIYSAIKVVDFNATGKDCFNPFITVQPPKGDLVNYCTTGDEYLVPLYLLTGNNDAWLTNILKRIADNITMDIMDAFDRLEDQMERDLFVDKTLTADIKDLAENPQRISERAEFEKELKKQGDNWANGLKAYLISCLNDIQLSQIIVDNHNRARAINIYENLNKGGVPLGTFELIMARFASESDENYYLKLVNNIKKDRHYLAAVSSASLKHKEEVVNYINSSDYNASIKMKCIDNEDEMLSVYIDSYLNVISLFSHCPDFNADKINISLIKRDKILDISPRDLKDNCDMVCDAIDLALHFLRMRCGIRSIKEINYTLILVVISYILLNPQYRTAEITYDILDAWYWSVVFSGYFNTDQNERAIISIKNLIELLNHQILGMAYKDDECNGYTWIKGIETNVFALDYFTEKEFLLLNKQDGTGIVPKEFLRDVVCQFFLAKTYEGIMDSSLLINPFIDKDLEKHHIIPLGSLKDPNIKVKDSEDDKLRKDRTYFLNSPINFMYITKEENISISDMNLGDYAKRISSYASKALFGLIGELKTTNETECKLILSNRFDHIKGQVMQHIDSLLP